MKKYSVVFQTRLNTSWFETQVRVWCVFFVGWRDVNHCDKIFWVLRPKFFSNLDTRLVYVFGGIECLECAVVSYGVSIFWCGWKCLSLSWSENQYFLKNSLMSLPQKFAKYFYSLVARKCEQNKEVNVFIFWNIISNFWNFASKKSIFFSWNIFEINLICLNITNGLSHEFYVQNETF